MKRFLITLFFGLSLINLYSFEVVLKGIFKQGGFFKADIPSSVNRVKFNDKDLVIYDNFIFCGLSKEQKPENKLTFYLIDGDSIKFDIKIKKRKYKVQKINNLPLKYTTKPKNKKLAERINKEYQTLLSIRKNIIYQNKIRFFKRFNLPLVYKISSVFGSERIVNSKPSTYHKGIDFAAPKGADVHSCANGVVVLTGDYFYNGKFVLIDHGLGVSSIYIHLSKITVLRGQYVTIGQKIGEVGDTGKAVGNHLHWGVYWYDIPIDPLLLTKSILQNKILKK